MASTENRPKSTSNTGRSRQNYKSVVNRPSNKQLYGSGPGNGGEKRQIVGQYMLGKTIGEGTFGKVKLGVHIPTGEKVAVKILEKSRIKEAADVRRVNREIKILKKARHGNIIQLYEVLDTQNTIYLIMECCEGGEMFDYIVAQKHVPEQQACKFFHQIVDGVDCLHINEITHRDLKPENLLLKSSPDGWIVKVVDFGLSNTHEGGKYLATACGSPCYAAPEMIAGRKYFGPLADIWSMGVILFALVCGYLPFEDSNTAVLYKKILSGDYKPAKWISPEVRDLIRNILEVDPRKRYTLEDIRKHPWYTQVTDQDIPRESINVYEDESTRNETLNVLANSGMDTQAVLDGLASKACNSNTAMYFLFEQKHRAQRLKNMSNNQQKSRAEMVVNKSDTTGLRIPAPTAPAPSSQNNTTTSSNAAAIPALISNGVPAIKPSPLFTNQPVQSQGPTGTSPKNQSAKNNIFVPLPNASAKTPYLQAPSILSQQAPQLNFPKSTNNNVMPSLDFYMKTGLALPLPNMNAAEQNAAMSAGMSARLKNVPKPDIPKLAVNSTVMAAKEVLVSQTSRPNPPSESTAPTMPNTARAALGGEDRPSTRRGARSQQGNGSAAEAGLGPEDLSPGANANVNAYNPAPSSSTSPTAPVAPGPVAPSAPPGGGAPVGGRRGRNLIPASTSQTGDTVTNTDNSAADGSNSVFVETRSDAQRNKTTNQGTQNLLG